MSDMLGLPVSGRYTSVMSTIPSPPSRRFPRVLLVLAFALQVGCSGGKATTNHVLELRAGSISEVDGWDRTELVVGGSRIWMDPAVAVHEDMIDSVEKRIEASGSPELLIRLDPRGAARLERLSIEQLSRPIVIVVDGLPSSAPIVLSPLKSLFIISAPHLGELEIDDLARRLVGDED